MLGKKLFHRGIASGEAFCNRTVELDRITKNIYKKNHTLLVSPRRYGKTSLTLRAIEQAKLPYAYIDLFMKYDAKAIMDEFLSGMGVLLSQVIKPSETALKKVESLLRNLNVSIKFGKIGLEFSLLSAASEKKINLKNLLTNIDELLAKQGKHAIVFIDEMQAITDTDACDEVEASLRFVAQQTNNISFIFSGSNRHILEKIFDDRSRPLYKLCHQITLERISAEHYKSFINKFAKIAWYNPLTDDTLETIFSVTKLHPYYVNILCGYLFELPKLPTEEDAVTCWKKICEEEQGSVARDIEFLTAKQKHLLGEIARHPGLREPTANEFLKHVNLTAKGVLGAIAILKKHAIIEKLNTGVIRIIDPVLEYWAKNPK